MAAITPPLTLSPARLRAQAREHAPEILLYCACRAREKTLRFIGVSTAGSLIHEVFPRWAGILGVEAAIVGVDIPHGAPAERFRIELRSVRDDEHCLGAVITSRELRPPRAAMCARTTAFRCSATAGPRP